MTLGRSLTFTVVDQTSRHCNVTTLERRDVAVEFFTSSSLHFQKAYENHPIHM